MVLLSSGGESIAGLDSRGAFFKDKKQTPQSQYESKAITPLCLRLWSRYFKNHVYYIHIYKKMLTSLKDFDTPLKDFRTESMP